MLTHAAAEAPAAAPPGQSLTDLRLDALLNTQVGFTHLLLSVRAHARQPVLAIAGSFSVSGEWAIFETCMCALLFTK